MRQTGWLWICAALLHFPSQAATTWSVIAVDRSTGRVVIASATCLDRDDKFLMGMQAVVVPGKRVAAYQAAVDRTHQNQMLSVERRRHKRPFSKAPPPIVGSCPRVQALAPQVQSRSACQERNGKCEGSLA